MPSAPPRPCRRSAAGCANTTTDPSGLCPACKPIVRREQDQRRGNARSRGYDRRWEKARLAYLKRHPLCECEECTREGRVTPAEVVDHIIPHRGDKALFWNRENWRAMSAACHNKKTAKEDGGFGRKSKHGKG